MISSRCVLHSLRVAADSASPAEMNFAARQVEFLRLRRIARYDVGAVHSTLSGAAPCSSIASGVAFSRAAWRRRCAAERQQPAQTEVNANGGLR